MTSYSRSLIVSRVLISIAVLVSAYIFIGSALPLLTLNERALAKFDGRRLWIVLHVITASVPLIVGPIQIWLGLRGKWPSIHRKLGVAYICCIAISACIAFYLAIKIDGPMGEAAGFFGAGILWLITTSMAYFSVRKHRYEQHKDWMIRSYVVTLAFVWFRVIVIIGREVKIGTFDDRLVVAAWCSWLVPLLMTELLFWRRKRLLRNESVLPE